MKSTQFIVYYNLQTFTNLLFLIVFKLQTCLANLFETIYVLLTATYLLGISGNKKCYPWKICPETKNIVMCKGGKFPHFLVLHLI